MIYLGAQSLVLVPALKERPRERPPIASEFPRCLTSRVWCTERGHLEDNRRGNWGLRKERKRKAEKVNHVIFYKLNSEYLAVGHKNGFRSSLHQKRLRHLQWTEWKCGLELRWSDPEFGSYPIWWWLLPSRCGHRLEINPHFFRNWIEHVNNTLIYFVALSQAKVPTN